MTEPRGSRGRRRKEGRRRKAARGGHPRRRRIALTTAAAVVLAVAGAGAWAYNHLSGNLRTFVLGDQGAEKKDAFGRTPINVLVLGSDVRNNAADCQLGGDCGGGGANADVEMVVHISADRSNATVMSVPRDTVTQVPACKDPQTGASTPGYTGMINSALSYGPACQVSAVHQLTGIPIDHFAMVDFSGVVKMSDAVGGVPVCVSSNVYDTYSHLKLSQGTHTLKGTGALEFVRSRHGFGDGSDLGRTYAQHLYLSSLIRQLKSAGTLTDPAALYNLADAATSALTVDDGLGSIGRLISLASDVSKVPTDRITFTTMQTQPDPNNPARLVPAPGARSLWAAIVNDQSLSGSGNRNGSAKAGSSAPGAAASSAPAVPASQIAVEVDNGSGITGRASAVASALIAQGFSPNTASGNAPSPTATTTLTYGAGDKSEAETAAKALGLPASHLQAGPGTGLRLVIGADWPSGTSYPAASASPSAADTHQALSNAHGQTAQTKGCAPVSTFRTVEVDGVPMTPSQAYAYAGARGVPDSAP